MEQILIIGASGHAKVIVDIIERQNHYKIHGFLDTYKKKGNYLFDYPILGPEDDINTIVEQHNIMGCFVAIGDNCTRKKMVAKIAALNPKLPFINAIHPHSTIGKNVELGRGIAIMPGVVINSDSKIGDFCILNTNSSLGHDGTMKNYSSISSGVRTGGNLLLEENSAISIGATIIENIIIGKDTIIGAGSLVTKNIPDHVVAYGGPAKVVRSRNPNDKYLFGEKNKTTDR